MRFAQCRLPRGLEREVPTGAAAAAGLGLAQPRAEEPLRLEPPQRQIHGGQSDRPPRVPLQFANYGYAGGVRAEAENCEEDALFDIAQLWFGS